MSDARVYPYQIPALLLPVIDTLPETSQRFVREMAERVEKYGDSTMFSAKQGSYLFSLRRRYLLDAQSVEPDVSEDAESDDELSPLQRLRARKNQLGRECYKLKLQQYAANKLATKTGEVNELSNRPLTARKRGLYKTSRHNGRIMEALQEIARQASLADAKQKQVG